MTNAIEEYNLQVYTGCITFKFLICKMEKLAKNDNAIDLVYLTREVEALEAEQTKVEGKFKTLENDISVEQHKCKLAEVNIADQNECVEFYTRSAEKLVERLNNVKMIHDQFNTALQWYEKLICDYEESCFNKQDELDIDEMIGGFNSAITDQITKQINDTQKNIDKQNAEIEQLLEELNFSQI